MLLGWIESRKPGTPNAGNAHARHEIATLLPLWIGFLAGTMLGAIAYIAAGLPCISAAILPVGGLTLWFARSSEPAQRIDRRS